MANLRDRVFGPTERERQLEAEMQAVDLTLRRLVSSQENAEIDKEFSTVAEGLAAVDMMLDAKGWSQLFEYDENRGLSLQQIKSASTQIRELIVGNPFVQNGSRVRTATTWGGGVEFGCQTRSTGKVKKLPVAIQTQMEEPRNQRYIFGNDAKEELERAAFSDGTFLVLGSETTKQMQRLNIHELSGDLRNPDNHEEILAYRRTWDRDPMGNPGDRKTINRWYYTDLTPIEDRQASITYQGKREKVERQYTIIDKGFNQQVGWAYGVPDALAIVAWSRLYKEFLVNGYVMSRSLAKLAYKVTVSSATGGNRAAVETTMPGQAGGTAVQGQGNDIAPLATAGKGYDFGSGSPLAAAMAAGLGVSLLALTANPAAASGSNAAAQTLDPIAKATAIMRRRSWDDFWVRIFRWLGLRDRLLSTWSDLGDDGIQRVMQAWTLVANSGLFKPEISQSGIAKAMSIPDPGEVPDGYLMPNNEASLARKDIDTDGGGGNPNDPGATGAGGATGGSGQGQNSPAGRADNDHDTDEE